MLDEKKLDKKFRLHLPTFQKFHYISRRIDHRYILFGIFFLECAWKLQLSFELFLRKEIPILRTWANKVSIPRIWNKIKMRYSNPLYFGIHFMGNTFSSIFLLKFLHYLTSGLWDLSNSIGMILISHRREGSPFNVWKDVRNV